MEVKEKDKPDTIASCLSFSFPVEYTKTTGIIAGCMEKARLLSLQKKLQLGKNWKSFFNPLPP